MVIRLCTDDVKMVDYWNNIDSQVSLDMDVLDDFIGEAKEIHRYCTELFCTALYYSVLYCTILYCNVLFCTALLSSVLICIVSMRMLLL